MPEAQKLNLTWKIEKLDQLSPKEVHDMLKIRVDVFVVEQECAYPELDGKDPDCWHVLGQDENGNTLAVARIAPAGVIYEEVSIGRVALDKAARGTGNGKTVMNEAIAFCRKALKAETIKIAAQLYLKKFYSELGFNQISETYPWDGIPHIDMRLQF